MDVVAICRVRNEGDIIEAFVRHNIKFVDKMIVVDDGSSDSTRDIVAYLLGEGLPIEAMHIEVFGEERETLYANLMRYAFRSLGAQWVILLDADEFIEVEGPHSLRELLADAPRKVLNVSWNNFVWSRNIAAEPSNPVLRLRMRQSSVPGQEKIIVPREIGLEDNAVPTRGKHAMAIDGKLVDSVGLDRVRLCHYPVRSVQQFTGKAASSRLHYILSGLTETSLGLQYQGVFNALLESEDPSELLELLSCRYPPYDLWIADAEVKDEPLRYVGGDLIYSSTTCSPYVSLLSYSKRLAEEISAQQAKNASRVNEDNNHAAALKRIYRSVVPGPLNGSVDAISPTGCIQGWARDEFHVLLPVEIEAVIGADRVGSSFACLFRHDLFVAGIGTGFYSFEIETDRDIEALIGVVVRRKDDGQELKQSQYVLDQLKVVAESDEL